MSVRHLIPGRLIALALMACVGHAVAQPAGASCEPGSTVAACALSYTEPEGAAPPTRIGGGVRGVGNLDVEVVALAPDHMGLVAHDQPVLYWYVSKAVPLRLEFSVVDDSVPEPIFDATIEDAALEGIHSLKLADYGVRLKPDIDYRWFVGIVPDEDARSSDIVASGTIRYRAPPVELVAQLSAAANPEMRAAVYARGGIWYDAIDSISRALDAAPGDSALRRDRARLLQQVGLDSVAAFDRTTPTQ